MAYTGSGKKESTYRIVYTSSQNKTYAQQLAEIKPYYDSLSEEEKRNSALILGGQIFQINITASGSYTSLQALPTDLVIDTMNINNSQFIDYYAGASHNKSTTTNTGNISLIIL